jgi:glutaredoxin
MNSGGATAWNERSRTGCYAARCAIAAERHTAQNNETEESMAQEIVMYSAQLCGDCQLLKAFMEKNGIDYENRDIRENPAYGEELKEKTGKLGVPYLIVNGEWKRGYDPGKPFSEEFARELLGV